MVEDARPPEGIPQQGERRKTTIIREGPPRREVLEAMGGNEAAPPAERVEKAVAAGTLLEGLAGTCAAVLAILALLGSSPMTLTAVGLIVLGGAVLASGGGFAAVMGRFRQAARWGEALAGGAGLEALIGAAVIAGGILVLANVVPMTLLPVTVIVLAGCFLLASGGFELLTADLAGSRRSPDGGGAAAAEVQVGLAGAALGVLALAGMNPLLFCEIAVLVLGAGLLGKCMVYSARVAGRLGRESR